MNAQQRRRQRRGYPHTVVIGHKGEDPWFMHDDRVQNARRWCFRQFKDRWVSTTSWDHAVFKFVRESEAVLFALKWV